MSERPRLEPRSEGKERKKEVIINVSAGFMALYQRERQAERGAVSSHTLKLPASLVGECKQFLFSALFRYFKT